MLRGKPDAILKAGDARDMILGKSGSDWRDSGDDFRQWFEKNNPEILKIKGHPMTDLEFRADQYVVKDPDNLRSRFAAFDPFRRNAAIAAAMGVAAPDLMAAEPDKKAEGGITSDDLIIEENPL